MPLRLDIKRVLSATSERVKCTDIHPQEPWILAALYSGYIFIWNYETQTLVKSIEVCDLPVRCAKFIPQKQWIICGTDEMHIHIYNYNTMERIKSFEAHTDYIRSLAIHPSKPYVLSSSDDMYIKLWDWEADWECRRVFEGHTHYVMQVEFNPKDTNTFCSASLDRSVKVWGLNIGTPHFSLEGHERGVNCIGYFRGGDKPYIISGADDYLLKIWDYQTKVCVATLEGHTNNISAVCFHPQLPIIISGSEDGTTRIWHANTYRLENTLNYGMERVWSISCLKGSNRVALGYDDGTIMISLGHEQPVVSMDASGKVVWAKNNEIQTGSVKSKADLVDAERMDVSVKELGNCEVYPQSLTHNPNGRLICVCGDGEYIIYTALALKNKSFGTALEFVWGKGAGGYAVRESASKVKIFKDFKEHNAFRPAFAAEGIFGGALLGIRSSDFIDFYDWEELRIIRRIDVCPTQVYWSESGSVVVLACESSYFLLRFNSELVDKYHTQGVEVGEQGIELSFDLEEEIPEKVVSGSFVGDCFIYTTGNGRLNYYVGGEVQTLAHLDKPQYLLGYLPKENRVYLMDQQLNIFSYSLLISVLIYQTAIVRRDFEEAAAALKNVPADQMSKIARFLEAQELHELALEVATDPEHRFDLAVHLNQLTLARDILLTSEPSTARWKQLGDAALAEKFDVSLATDCYERSDDLSGLLLLHTSLGDADGLSRLAALAKKADAHNIAFVCLFLLNRTAECVDLLVATDRIPEAAFMSRTYLPSRITEILALWKEDLSKVSIPASESLADPLLHPELFAGMEEAIKLQKFFEKQAAGRIPAKKFAVLPEGLFDNVLKRMQDGELDLSIFSSWVDAEGPSEEVEVAEEVEVEGEAGVEEEVAVEEEEAAVEEEEEVVVAKPASPEKKAPSPKKQEEKKEEPKKEEPKKAPVATKAVAKVEAAAEEVDDVGDLDDDLMEGLGDLGLDDLAGEGGPSLEQLNADLDALDADW